MKTALAFDFGASSGRAVKAVYSGGEITYEEIHRFDNIPVEINGHIHHNVPMILNEIDTAIKKAGKADALAFDTCGVDYGLLDENGKLINLPYRYRDSRTGGIINRALKKLSANELYAETGNQIMSINTLFQLIGDENLKKAASVVFMPDLFAYLLTGKAFCEKSIASTSQMLNPINQNWSKKVLNAFNINSNIFPPLINSASITGEYKGIKVIAAAGHDTQCAVAAMPCLKDNSAFLSCGTWSLIGCELSEPVLTELSMKLELSNELGANGKINYLKNISGLWLIQETRRYYSENGVKYSYNDLETQARSAKPFKCFIDPDDNLFSSHGSLPEKIAGYCKATNQEIPETIGETVRCIYESLALKYRFSLEQISECTGKKFEALHLLGGGAKDSFLCELTSSSINMPVLAGPVEATALGNIILQLIAMKEIKSIDEGREIILKSEKIKTYNPLHTEEWDSAYSRFVKIIK
ncbi:MAG: rhamnulokinase [Clostridiales bacterium]|nr:rhamnulokinase [Clostridiales bacterium]